MRKVTLQEQINRSLKMMGILTEAAPPRSNFLGVILSKLAKNEKDVFFAAIEKKVGESLPQKGLNSVLTLINNNKISRKEVLSILMDVFKQAGKDVGLFSNFIKDGAPTFFSDLQKLIKGNVSKQDIKGVLPELEDLPDELFNDLLIKAGFKEATEESIDSMARSMSDIFPFLFRKEGKIPFFKNLANEDRINDTIEKLSKEFAGKNDEGIRDIIEKKLRDLETDIKANNLGPKEMKTWEKFTGWAKKNLNPLVYKKVNGQSVIAARQSIKSLLGKAAVGGAVGAGAIATMIIIEYIQNWRKNDTGSSWKDFLLAWDQMFGGTTDVVTRKTYKENDIRDLYQYLTDTFGDLGWSDPNKFKVKYVGQTDVVSVTDNENKARYFLYDKTNRTYNETDSAGKPLSGN